MWFFYSWFQEEWYLVEDSTISCSPAEMKKAVEGSRFIATQVQNLSPSPEPTVSDLVYIIQAVFPRDMLPISQIISKMLHYNDHTNTIEIKKYIIVSY